MRFRSLLLLIILTAALTAQTGSSPTSGIHPEDMDPTCKPCSDFWRYVNGGWLDKNPIPADQANWGHSGVLRKANRERIQTILESAESGSSAKPGTDRRKMGDFYASCMNTAVIESRGLSPLQPDFDRIAAIRSIG